MQGKMLSFPNRPRPARLDAGHAGHAGHTGAGYGDLPPQPAGDEFPTAWATIEKAKKGPRHAAQLLPPRRSRSSCFLTAALVAAVVALVALLQWKVSTQSPACDAAAVGHVLHAHGFAADPPPGPSILSPYGQFPRPNDTFQFQPCTNKTNSPPALNDTNPRRTWAGLFDPDPAHWKWAAPLSQNASRNGTIPGDPYSGRGIFLCGYLEVPLDYTNESDPRIVRLAISKLQVSGLALATAPANSTSSAGKKSERTLLVNPGGPGGSGKQYALGSGQNMSTRFSDGQFDVLGWDPRGVGDSVPAVECMPHDADRDRWYLYTSQHRDTSPSPRAQLEIVDAMSEAVFRSCWERQGDLGRFLTTAFVARDIDRIRKALEEDDVSGYFVSYGTGIGQTYAGMFPDRVGRLILDGTEYVRDHRYRGGFGWAALDNVTDAWHDGFIGECLNAGPEYCPLAKPKEGKPVSLPDLLSRMDALITSLITRPVPAYLKTSGPTLVTRSFIVDYIYSAMYSPKRWNVLAQALYEFESGNVTALAKSFEGNAWWYDPEVPCPAPGVAASDSELGTLVICSDSYDAPEPDDMDWWLSLWSNMTTQSWIAGNSRFYNVFPCRHYTKFWPRPAEVFRGDMNHTLRTPVLLIAETYDPATPLRNGRRLAHEMGTNARLIVHHGYGHSSVDTSNCTDSTAKAYILDGTIPEKPETNCYANERPYLYGTKKNTTSAVVVAPGFEMQSFRKYIGDGAI